MWHKCIESQINKTLHLLCCICVYLIFWPLCWLVSLFLGWIYRCFLSFALCLVVFQCLTPWAQHFKDIWVIKTFLRPTVLTAGLNLTHTDLIRPFLLSRPVNIISHIRCGTMLLLNHLFLVLFSQISTYLWYFQQKAWCTAYFHQLSWQSRLLLH